MINAAAKLGAKCAMIGVVGDDPFGRCVTNRLKESGVDCSMVRVHPRSFHRCSICLLFQRWQQKFLYRVHHAAPGMMNSDDIDIKKLEGTKWVHITGFTMSVNQDSADAVYKLVRELPEGTRLVLILISRPEALSVEQNKNYANPL